MELYIFGIDVAELVGGAACVGAGAVGARVFAICSTGISFLLGVVCLLYHFWSNLATQSNVLNVLAHMV